MSRILHKQIYAGIMAVLNDSRSYYRSGISNKGQYDEFHDEGKEALVAFIEQMAPMMLRQQDLELDELAKKIVLEELKE
jgi:hypothetical protein